MRNPIDAAKAATDAFLAMLAAFANPAAKTPTNRVGRRAQRGPHQPGWNHRNFKTAPFAFTTAERPSSQSNGQAAGAVTLDESRLYTEGNPR